MRAKQIPARVVVWFSTALVLLAGVQLGAHAADMKFEEHLLWGTDEAKPPEGKSYTAVQAEVKKKLATLGLKWTNWFEVNRKGFTVGPNGTVHVQISDKCELVVKSLTGATLEVSLIGKGKEVMKRTQSLPKGEMLALGGNAPNSTAWLVVLKRIE